MLRSRLHRVSNIWKRMRRLVIHPGLAIVSGSIYCSLPGSINCIQKRVLIFFHAKTPRGGSKVKGVTDKLRRQQRQAASLFALQTSFPCSPPLFLFSVFSFFLRVLRRQKTRLRVQTIRSCFLTVSATSMATAATTARAAPTTTRSSAIVTVGPAIAAVAAARGTR